MLKYFKRQKSRLNSTNENDQHYNNTITRDAVDQATGCSSIDGAEEFSVAAAKRHSLRSTSSFCDEVFLEELASVGSAGGAACGGGSGSEDDAVSYGALSLGAVSSGGTGAAASGINTMAVNTIVGFDGDLFKYHSRLSMTVTAIVNEPNCLSYFVQFLDKKNALSLIKFYLDTANFKNAALAQLRKEHKSKLTAQQIPEESDYEAITTTINDTDDQIQNKQQQQQQLGENQSSGTVERHINVVSSNSGGGGGAAAASDTTVVEDDDDNSNVPELKTLCDLTMRKPLTDDEKSQIYAETTKHIINNKSNNDRQKLKASSELSLCSLASNFSEITENAVISMASVKDALAIYKKYLIQDAQQHIELPVDILSTISLIICKKATEEDECITSITADCFVDAQLYVLKKLEKDFLNDFLQSTHYAKYCVELIDGHHLDINDILHSEVTLFYFMEYLEQHQERDCLDFWSNAINYRKSYVSSQETNGENEKEAQKDAMIIYEKFFSLQNEQKLWSSNKLRAHVEACICTEGMVLYCFDLPLRVGAKYLERKYLKAFLKSSLFSNYINELKSKIQEDFETKEGLTKFPAKLKLRKCVSDKSSTNRHRKTLSDCTLDRKLTISQHNTLLAAMDSQHHSHSTSAAHLKQFQLNIDSSQLTNPDLLWHRSNSNNLKFGRVNSLGRYERDFVSPSDALHTTTSMGSLKSMHNWSLSLNGNKLKNAMRKLVNLPEDNVQEEIAWQVAEMIVKDVTSVTMGAKPVRNGDAGGREQKT